jgi:hypothetical protein
MRYHHESWNEVDRVLESFKYARRSLLVLTALAMPFAAWEAVVATPHAAVKEDTIEVRTVKNVQPIEQSIRLQGDKQMTLCAHPADAPGNGDAAV